MSHKKAFCRIVVRNAASSPIYDRFLKDVTPRQHQRSSKRRLRGLIGHLQLGVAFPLGTHRAMLRPDLSVGSACSRAISQLQDTQFEVRFGSNRFRFFNHDRSSPDSGTARTRRYAAEVKTPEVTALIRPHLADASQGARDALADCSNTASAIAAMRH